MLSHLNFQYRFLGKHKNETNYGLFSTKRLGNKTTTISMQFSQIGTSGNDC